MNILFKLQNKFPPLTYILISLIAALDALVSVIFVYPNDFAPEGVYGLVTMAQYLLNFSAGYMFFIVNIPMVVAAFFVLDKRFAIKNFLYVIFFSVMCLVFQNIISAFDLSHLEYRAVTPESSVVLAISIGAFNGLAYALTVSMGGSTGGTDILASLINKFKPAFNTVWIIFTANAGVAVASYFVYGRRTFPVLMSVICSFVGGVVSDVLIKGATSALKFEVITPDAQAIADEIMTELEHGCTKLPAYGMYSGEESYVLICVVNTRQRADFEKIIARHEGTFAYCSQVRRTYGYFDRIK